MQKASDMSFDFNVVGAYLQCINLFLFSLYAPLTWGALSKNYFDKGGGGPVKEILRHGGLVKEIL